MIKFPRKSPKSTWVGLDLGKASLKWLELSYQNNSYRVEAYAQMDICDLNKFCAQFKSTRKNIVMALPSAEVMTKTISMTLSTDPTECEQQILYEAERLFPHPLEEIYWDFKIAEDQQEVIFTACRKEFLNKQLSIFNSNKLKINTVDLEAYAIARVCQNNMQDLALVLLEKDFITLFVLEKNKIIFNYGEPIIQQHSNSLVNQISLQLRRILQIFQTHHPTKNIKHLSINGDLNLINGLADILASEINMKIFNINPFDGMEFAADLDKTKLQQLAPNLLRCCGLAMRANGDNNINLLPWREQNKLRRKRNFNNSLYSSLASTFLLIIIIYFLLDNKITQQNIQYRRLEQQVLRSNSEQQQIKLMSELMAVKDPIITLKLQEQAKCKH